jgi:hypothetical protein
MACRRSFRDRKRGGETFGPFRFRVTELKKFRYAGVQVRERLLQDDGRHLAQPFPARCGLGLRQPGGRASVMYGSPAACAACRAARASLNTTRAHPNALASASR